MKSRLTAVPALHVFDEGNTGDARTIADHCHREPQAFWIPARLEPYGMGITAHDLCDHAGA